METVNIVKVATATNGRKYLTINYACGDFEVGGTVWLIEGVDSSKYVTGTTAQVPTKAIKPFN